MNHYKEVYIWEAKVLLDRQKVNLRVLFYSPIHCQIKIPQDKLVLLVQLLQKRNLPHIVVLSFKIKGLIKKNRMIMPFY
jgi:hypothetical protein